MGPCRAVWPFSSWEHLQSGEWMERSTHWSCVCLTWAERTRRQAGRWGWGAQPGLYQKQDALRLGPVRAQLPTDPLNSWVGFPAFGAGPSGTAANRVDFS